MQKNKLSAVLFSCFTGMLLLGSAMGAEGNLSQVGKTLPVSVVASNSVPFDINQADEQAWMKLKGIGPKLAEAIMSYRKVNGNFKHIDELSLVKGLTEKRLNRIQKENQLIWSVH